MSVTRLPFEHSIYLRFAQCDTSGGVHFPRYMEMANDLVEVWFRERLGVDFHEFHLTERCGLPVINTELRVLAPSHLGERLTLGVGIQTLGRSSLILTIRGHANGEDRFEIRHKLVFVALDDMRAMPIPASLRPGLERDLMSAPTRTLDGTAPTSPEPRLAEGSAPQRHHRHSLVVRTSHCDPAGIVFYARYFEMLAAAQEDWFERALLTPVGGALRERGLRLQIDGTAAGFERVSRISEQLDIDVWVSAINDPDFELACIISCAGEIRLRARINARLSPLKRAAEGNTSPRLPDDLHEWMARFIAPANT